MTDSETRKLLSCTATCGWHLTGPLVAVKFTSGWAVRDEDGGVWHPDRAAQVEILAAEDPEGAVLEMCQAAVHRGVWHD